MTTTVTVKTNHGWPVDVTPVDPVTGVPLLHAKYRVAASSEDQFYVHNGQDLLVHEVQAEEDHPAAHMPSPIMKHFAFEHLPPHLQAVSRPLGRLALHMDQTLPDGPEKSAGLRKLLEAKDCLVRAKLG